jgi:hypothetical protein
MPMLLRLPLMLLELLLRGGASALKDLLRLLSGGAGEEAPYVPGPEAEAEAAAAASARREAERLAAAEAAARRPEARPSAARQRTKPTPIQPVEPAPEPAPAPAHVSEEAEQVASFGPEDDPGSTIEVQAPWPGYDGHSAAEVVKRVRSGDEATRAVVLLYERTHKARSSVIAAAEASSN